LQTRYIGAMAKVAPLTTVVVFFTLASVLLAETAQAATITVRSDAELRCNVFLEGEIVRGDAARVSNTLAVLEAQHGGDPGDRHSLPGGWRICFNSHGGNMAEAILIVRVMRNWTIGSGIPNGAQCLSACALAFMGGVFHGRRSNSDHYLFSNRVLHPRGRLGFHSPSLGNLSVAVDITTVNSAYATALETVAALTELRTDGFYDFPDYVLVNMLRTPPSSFFYIDTVERAMAANVPVAPVAFPNDNLDTAFREACFNFFRRWDPAQPEVYEPSVVLYNYVGDGRSRVRIDATGGYGTFANDGCVISVELESIDEGYNIVSAQGDIGAPNHIVSMADDLDSQDFFSFMAYPGATQLSTLSSGYISSLPLFRSSIQRSVAHNVTSCWIATPRAEVTRVDAFVNLRQEASFSSRIIREIPRGEVVTLTDPGRLLFTENRCIEQCQNLSNGQDAYFQQMAYQCVQGNMIWAHVRDNRGNEGWISRRYLAGVP